MSNYLAIATVTEALRVMLKEPVRVVKEEASVETLPLDKAATTDGTFVNIFLYQITPNTALRNADLPTRAADRTLMQKPRAALDLHYLLTAHGKDNLYEPQRLLGIVVRTLHTTPFLSRSTLIAAADALPGSNLADSTESVKFTPVTLTLDELSKLWSSFFQTKYALSLAYLASVIFIEGEETPSSPLPVKSHRVSVVPSLGPIIERIASQATPTSAVVDNQPILSSYTLHLFGRGLRSGSTEVRLGDDLVAPTSIRDDVVTVRLLDVPAPGLRAGVRTVQIVQSIDLGTAFEPHRAFESNAAAFMLAPDVAAAAFVPAATAADVPAISVTVDPEVANGQRLVLVLDESPLPGDHKPASFAFSGVAVADSTTPSVNVAGLASGTYLVRLRVDGAESPIDPTAPVTVTVP